MSGSNPLEFSVTSHAFSLNSNKPDGLQYLVSLFNIALIAESLIGHEVLKSGSPILNLINFFPCLSNSSALERI
jgi:hypothetical protein